MVIVCILGITELFLTVMLLAVIVAMMLSGCGDSVGADSSVVEESTQTENSLNESIIEYEYRN